MNIKRGDNVLITKGKDRNKTGKVVKSIALTNKVVIEGINITKRHVKPTKANPQGGIIDITRPVSASNAMIICPHCTKAVRVSYKQTEKGKLRVCRKCQAALDQEK